MKQIVLKIGPDGVIQAETLNMQGHECQKYVQEMEILTASVAVESRYKPEFAADCTSSQREAVSERVQDPLNRNLKE